MFRVLLCVSMKHDWALVGVAAVVCVVASWASFFLYAKAPRFPAWRRWCWIGMTGLVAGSGIWTTHFVAMLAFETGLRSAYAAAPTLGSLMLAIIGTAAGFACALSGRGSKRPRLAAVLGGAVVGLSITLMHYVGMLGYETQGWIEWDGGYVAASVLIGAVCGAGALAIGRASEAFGRQVAAGVVLALGIVLMHFTGMTAVTIVPDPRDAPPVMLLSDPVLATIAVGVTALILITVVGGVAFDAASRYGNLRRLREALDAMADGIAFYGPDDRLVAWNAKYAEICAACGWKPAVGLQFADLLASGLATAAFSEAVGREAEWLEQRNAVRAGAISSLPYRLSNGRWMRVTERRTIDGGVVSNCVDITELKRAEAAMIEARDAAQEQARRADVAEAIAGLGHWRLDAKTGQVTWSDQLYRIYGFEPGKKLDLEIVMAMSHPADAAENQARLARQIAGGGAEHHATRIIRANGEVRHISGDSRPELGPGGEVVAVVGALVDVTDQKQAEMALAASEERFRRMAMNAPSIIAESRLDGVMTYISPACLALTGFRPEELVGRPFSALMHPEDAETVQAMCAAVFQSKGRIAPWTVEFRATHKSGQPIWMECRPTLVADPATGRFTGITDVISDITQRKALEAELRAAQAEAEAAAQVKAEFLANMSHELRTPLTSILGFTGLASEQPDLTDLTRTYVGRVRDASQALLCTVNDILDFSKLEAGQVAIHPQPINVARLARATLELFTPQAGAKDLQLTLDVVGSGEDLVVAADPDRLRQILLNFVGNAVKFTEQGGVTLRTGYDAQRQSLSVEVVDTGAGIASAKLAMLFQRFSQVDGSLTRAKGGTGLGLAICKGLVEAMGGEIGVESRLGEGSRFWFRIPAAPALMPSVEADASDELRPAFEGVRVLVVDDHATNRELARLFLAGVGAEVTEAADGEEAVSLAKEWPFDAILMDLRMPRLDGQGALARIRGEPGPNDVTPILAFTADATPELADTMLAAGFDAVVAKPLTPEALLSAIGRATAYVDPPAMDYARAS
jgi:PAS domain S-box-containing protein